jgi:hypothetical protein
VEELSEQLQTTVFECKPSFIGRVSAIAGQDHSHDRGAWRLDRARTVGDNENVQPKASRHAVDFLAHRARITIA